MFEFITVSNGEIVVRHLAEGHVYRFRPLEPGNWARLVPSRADYALEAQAASRDYGDEALQFAAREVAELGMTAA